MSRDREGCFFDDAAIVRESRRRFEEYEALLGGAAAASTARRLALGMLLCTGPSGTAGGGLREEEERLSPPGWRRAGWLARGFTSDWGGRCIVVLEAASIAAFSSWRVSGLPSLPSSCFSRKPRGNLHRRHLPIASSFRAEHRKHFHLRRKT